jgi:hypothetical protein
LFAGLVALSRSDQNKMLAHEWTRRRVKRAGIRLYYDVGIVTPDYNPSPVAHSVTFRRTISIKGRHQLDTEPGLL